MFYEYLFKHRYFSTSFKKKKLKSQNRRQNSIFKAQRILSSAKLSGRNNASIMRINTKGKNIS